MKKSQVIFSKYSPLMSVDTKLVGKDGNTIDTHYANYYDETRVVIEKDGPLNFQGIIDMIDDQDSDTLLPKADHYTEV